MCSLQSLAATTTLRFNIERNEDQVLQRNTATKNLRGRKTAAVLQPSRLFPFFPLLSATVHPCPLDIYVRLPATRHFFLFLCLHSSSSAQPSFSSLLGLIIFVCVCLSCLSLVHIATASSPLCYYLIEASWSLPAAATRTWASLLLFLVHTSSSARLSATSLVYPFCLSLLSCSNKSLAGSKRNRG